MKLNKMDVSTNKFSTYPFHHRSETELEVALRNGECERWLANSFSEGHFPLAFAPLMAHLSGLAYLGQVDHASGLSGCELALAEEIGAAAITRFENRNAEGYGFVFRGQAFLLFCGTNDMSRDWVHNLLAIRKSHTLHEEPTRDIHMGFAQHFQLLRPQIDHWLAGLPAVDGFVCTGHSLGGTLAVLMAQLLGQRQIPVTGVMTFGAPAVGGRAFNDEYLWHDRTWRVVDFGDPIPKSTPEQVGFKHVGVSVSSRTCFTDQTQPPSGPKAAPSQIGIYPKAVDDFKLGNMLKGNAKKVSEAVLNMYRARPRHCKVVYRNSMQRMLEENLSHLPDAIIRRHYDTCGMRSVPLYRGVEHPEEQEFSV